MLSSTFCCVVNSDKVVDFRSPQWTKIPPCVLRCGVKPLGCKCAHIEPGGLQHRDIGRLILMEILHSHKAVYAISIHYPAGTSIMFLETT